MCSIKCWHALIFLFSFMAMSSTAQLANDFLITQPIELVAGLTKPPFIVEASDRGIQLDIIRAALAQQHRKVSFIYLPLGRNLSAYYRLGFDGVITLSASESLKNIYLTKPYISYQNVVVTLAKRKLTIDKVDDLRDKLVIAFQNAQRFLGKAYQMAVVDNEGYWEMADQRRQIAMLFSNRVDAIVIDINIFKFLRREGILSSADYEQPYQIHKIFTERTYVAGFRSKALRDEFDHGLTRIKANGRYQQIIDNYLD